jgi:hypothetical protein
MGPASHPATEMESRGDAPKLMQLSRFVLKGKENWQLWKTDVLLWAKHRKVFGLLSGTESRPNAAPSTADDGASYNAPKLIEDFDSRESGLHIALNSSMSEHHRILTMHCTTPAEIWKFLCNLYESRVSTDIIGLREKFQSIRLESAAKIPKFLDEVKLAENALAVAGKGHDDDELALHILEKFPPSMKDLQKSIRYGHPDMLQLDNICTTLLRYHQGQGRDEDRTVDFAAISTHRTGKGEVADKTNSECFDCGETGHWRGDPECKKPKKKESQRKKGSAGRTGRRHEAHVAMCAFGDDPAGRGSWVIDSAASASMSPSAHVDEGSKRKILIGNGTSLNVAGICRHQRIGGLEVGEVLVVPAMKVNLLSVGAMCDNGLVDEVVFTRDECRMVKDGEPIAKGVRQGRMYVINDQVEPAFISMETWHERMCHFSTETIKNLTTKGRAAGATVDEAASDNTRVKCEVCALTRKTDEPYPEESLSREKAPGRTIHVDLCGPIEVESVQGCRYVMPVTDDYSRFTVAYFMPLKSDAIHHLMDLISYFERETGNQVVNVRADNGGEFT